MKKIVGIVLSSVILLGCVAQQKNAFSPPRLPIETIKPSTTIKNAQIKKNNSAQSPKISIVYVPSVQERGSLFKQKLKSSEYAKTQKKSFKVSVENIPITDFINLVFGKILKVSYSVDRNVQRLRDRITFRMSEPTKESSFLDAVLSILRQYGISVENKNGMYFISRNRRMQNKGATVYFFGRSIPEDILPTERVGIIVPLYYIKAQDYSRIIRNLALSNRGLIEVLPKRNYLFILDSPSYVTSALRYIDIFDRPDLAEKTSVLIHFEYILPSEFVKKLKEILPLQGIPIANSISEPGIVLKPMDDLSYVFVITPKKKWLKLIYFWRNKLDNISSLGNQSRLFVYYPENRRASDLAKVFTGIEGIAEKSGENNKKGTGTLLNNVRTTVDEDRNAIIIMCKPSEYKQVKEVLKRLDILPKQVFVQVTILEVTLAGKLDYGIEWYLRHTGRYNGILQTLGGLGIGASGLNYSLITDTGKFTALVNAFAKKNLINVLSSPSLIVMDNKNASINVGTQVPIVTSESSANDLQDNGTTSLLRTISYRNTGVILNISPTINSNGIVTMDISQEVSDAQTNNTSKIDSPLILTRSIKTTVSLKSGMTLLLGGLIKKSRSVTVQKVPLIGDIPVIGNLFKTTSKGNTKTELIVEVTPYILSNSQASDKITKAYRELMDLLK